jgi:hypothetical protein
MSNIIKIIEQDIVFLSYDEPNAEKNYADLLAKVPWAKRVHGVKGSDAAHKACAAQSETEYFVTVDADNIVDPKFLEVEIDLDALGLTNENVFSWCGRVAVNGLMYGNGGLKLWTRKFVNEMRTHENSDPTDEKGKVEFCFDDRYYQFNDNYSESVVTASPFQAWRAGFREGVKMSLSEGSRLADPGQAKRMLHWKNLERLMVWSHIGMDVPNGVWAIYGARQGCYMTNLTNWDYHNVRDFDFLNNLWSSTVSKEINEDNILGKIEKLGIEITKNLDIPMGAIDSNASTFFKTVYRNPPRTKVT